MLKLINPSNIDSFDTSNKFHCPSCVGKGRSVRGFQPKFKTLIEKEGKLIQVFRLSLMSCKRCELYYSVTEIQQEESWHFASYQDFETYQSMEGDYTAPAYLGSTSSEWSKRQAHGVIEHR